MITDITKANVSKIVSGTMGKNILIYGDGGTGKTSNAIQAPDVLVLGFENGLAGLEGVKYFILNGWTDFQQAVKLLVLAAANTSKPLPYKTIVIDGIDRMGILAKKYISNLHGANNFSEVGGDARYSIWDEFKTEIDIQIGALMNSPYSILWIDHATVTKDNNAAGEEISVISPSGDDRVVDKIYDLCDICAYAQPQPNTVDGREVLSTLFFHASNQVRTKSRFTRIVPFITEWNYDKLVKAINDAISAETAQPVSEDDGVSEIREKKKAEVEAAAPDTASNPVSPVKPLSQLVNEIGAMLVDMQTKKGTCDDYKRYIADVLKEPAFSCKKATEEQRPQVEAIHDFLVKSGYQITTIVAGAK